MNKSVIEQILLQNLEKKEKEFTQILDLLSKTLTTLENVMKDLQGSMEKTNHVLDNMSNLQAEFYRLLWKKQS